ncbi:hypothetical protein Lal_00046229 [Lupinus albus]|uniref:Putative EF-hand domain pair protein n=1 Tax=Lupinus albus TaxID=3870 RepID=A0A6A5NH02_LUPAL|nr:putative EF-hand domain pair protein [Lupinus albus]KAF1886991.1 hypothetical protein Lal_00046229 [Lupinus albus]
MAKFDSKALPSNLPKIEKKIREILRKADKNKDNCLSRDELKKAFKDLGSYLPDLRSYLAMKKADINRDGRISGEDELDMLVDYILDCKSKHYKM